MVKCPSGKNRYPTKKGARIALKHMQRKTQLRRKKTEQHLYQCIHCNGWHLTSQQRPRGESNV